MKIAGDKIIGISADNHTNVARREERVDTVIRLFQQTAKRRDKRNMLAEEVKILHITRFRLLQSDGGGRHGGFKT